MPISRLARAENRAAEVLACPLGAILIFKHEARLWLSTISLLMFVLFK